MNNKTVLDRPVTYRHPFDASGMGEGQNGALVIARQISPQHLELNIDRCGHADLVLNREDALALAAALMEFVAGSKS